MIGRTNAGSGTGGLLINVVGGLSQPETPTYGTVWLETEVPINGWEILSVAPDWEAAEGHVYLQDAPSTSGDTPNFSIIDAAKKPYGAIWERLIGAFQRINGEWVRLNGAMWRDGVWTPFFGATINITYPAGSTCTATDGVTTLAAPDTTGVWACVVPNAGAWTVLATDSVDTRSKTVSIITNGQIENIVILYNRYLYKSGDKCTDITGGWKASGWPYDNDYAVAPSIDYQDTYVKLTISGNKSANKDGVFEPVNRIDLTDVDKIQFKFNSVTSSTTDYTFVRCGVFDRSQKSFTAISSSMLPLNSSDVCIDVDVSSISGLQYVGVFLRAYGILTVSLAEIQLVLK